MNQITKKTVVHIAGLARIVLSDDELPRMTKDLEDILHYIQKLENLDVKTIDPTSHVLPLKNVFRDDYVIPSLTQAEALNTAITRRNGSFTVPLVIE